MSQSWLELTNQCGTRTLYVFEYSPERRVIGVVRVENIQFASVVGDETEQQLNFSLLLGRRREFMQCTSVTLVKGDDEVVGSKVCDIKLTGPMLVAVVASLSQHFECSIIGSFAHMPVACSARCDHRFMGETVSLEACSRDDFGHWRTANVAGAHEANSKRVWCRSIDAGFHPTILAHF